MRNRGVVKQTEEVGGSMGKEGYTFHSLFRRRRYQKWRFFLLLGAEHEDFIKEDVLRNV